MAIGHSFFGTSENERYNMIALHLEFAKYNAAGTVILILNTYTCKFLKYYFFFTQLFFLVQCV